MHGRERAHSLPNPQRDTTPPLVSSSNHDAQFSERSLKKPSLLDAAIAHAAEVDKLTEQIKAIKKELQEHSQERQEFSRDLAVLWEEAKMLGKISDEQDRAMAKRRCRDTFAAAPAATSR
ncbi:MAG: hypothetical protein Q9218_006461 [Villophora microphyllina]